MLFAQSDQMNKVFAQGGLRTASDLQLQGPVKQSPGDPVEFGLPEMPMHLFPLIFVAEITHPATEVASQHRIDKNPDITATGKMHQE